MQLSEANISADNLDDPPPYPGYVPFADPGSNVFRQSMSLQFVTRDGKRPNAVPLSPDTKTAVQTGLEGRRSVTLSYSNFWSAFTDLLSRAGSPFSPWPTGPSSHNDRILSAVKELLRSQGLLEAHRGDILTIIRDYERLDDLISLLVHGFAEIHELKSGEIRFYFKSRGARGKFSPTQLTEAAVRMKSFSLRAQDLLSRICRIQANQSSNSHSMSERHEYNGS